MLLFSAFYLFSRLLLLLILHIGISNVNTCQFCLLLFVILFFLILITILVYSILRWLIIWHFKLINIQVVELLLCLPLLHCQVALLLRLAEVTLENANSALDVDECETWQLFGIDHRADLLAVLELPDAGAAVAEAPNLYGCVLHTVCQQNFFSDGGEGRNCVVVTYSVLQHQLPLAILILLDNTERSITWDQDVLITGQPLDRKFKLVVADLLVRFVYFDLLQKSSR